MLILPRGFGFVGLFGFGRLGFVLGTSEGIGLGSRKSFRNVKLKDMRVRKGLYRLTLTPVATLWQFFLSRGACRAQCTCRTRSYRKNNPP